jgi:uncharacterized membrane protein YkoI
MKSVKFNILFSFAVILFFLISCPNLFSQEKKISEKEMPSAVLNSFHKTYPKGEIKGTSIEKEHGKTYYEIESMDGTQRRDILYSKEGVAVEVEETLASNNIPDFVKNSVLKKYPKGEIKRAEKITSGNKVSYEVKVKSGNKRIEAVLDSKGNIQKVEKMKKENEKEEKNEEKENDKD